MLDTGEGGFEAILGQAAFRRRKKKNKVSDVTEIMNLIMRVDHEVDAQLGAIQTHCEKRTGAFLLFSLLPHFCFFHLVQ